jgi:hypothetical protein
VSPAALPDEVRRLFWEVDPGTVDLERHSDYVLERVMTRGGWAAMRWLRATYPVSRLADFLRRKATRLPPRERAYRGLIAGGLAGGRPGRLAVGGGVDRGHSSDAEENVEAPLPV